METGAIAEPATAALGRMLEGVQNPQKRMLLDAGVPLTPGQLLANDMTEGAPGGPWKGLEDKFTSMPVVGEMIKERQAESFPPPPPPPSLPLPLGYNRAALNQVLEPIGQQLPRSVPVGREGLAHVSDALSQQYDRALRNLYGDVDPQFNQDLGRIAHDAAQALPPAHLQNFERILDNNVVDPFTRNPPQGQATRVLIGDELKGIDSELGRHGRELAKDPNHWERETGRFVSQLQDAYRSMITRVNAANGGDVTALNNANAACARWVRVRDAAYGTNTAFSARSTSTRQHSAARRPPTRL